MEEPSMRPIISNIGMATYKVAKYFKRVTISLLQTVTSQHHTHIWTGEKQRNKLFGGTHQTT